MRDWQRKDRKLEELGRGRQMEGMDIHIGKSFIYFNVFFWGKRNKMKTSEIQRKNKK
jgi:hypothetical protein